MNKKIGIIGGDLRLSELAKMLLKDEFEISIYGLENAEGLKKIEKSQNIENLLEKSDIIIGPIPFSTDKVYITAPFSEEKILVQNLISKMKNKIFIAGSINQEFFEEFSKNNKVIDIIKKEELAILNAISTSEGTIKIIIEQTLTTIHNSSILVMGFGRIGKILSNMLKKLNANIYVEARKNEDIAWIQAYGYTPIRLNELDQNLQKFDVIVNTIPNIILNKARLETVKKECLIIDLASNPGGVDFNAAKEKGINAIWALALPGKIAPITSAKYIKETLYNIFEEA